MDAVELLLSWFNVLCNTLFQARFVNHFFSPWKILIHPRCIHCCFLYFNVLREPFNAKNIFWHACGGAVIEFDLVQTNKLIRLGDGSVLNSCKCSVPLILLTQLFFFKTENIYILSRHLIVFSGNNAHLWVNFYYRSPVLPRLLKLHCGKLRQKERIIWSIMDSKSMHLPTSEAIFLHQLFIYRQIELIDSILHSIKRQ